ncbi:TerC/Alx family metal homeostasis membrane protein [Candidatus Saccharibacteria bacterium]|nr:TerC/Alx family metal homeostasis membrane protein [Candidatus Saccharibacteria bacterium]
MLASTASNEILELSIQVSWWHWALLGGWFLFLILFDILVVHRKDHAPSLRGSAIQSSIWIALGIGLGAVVWAAYGAEAGGQYFNGYLIEKSLSVDNVFAWSVILGYFKIPKKYQHRVLFWGIFGAIVLRTIFVFAGIAIIERFEPILLVFGLILVYSGYKLLKTHKEDEFNPANSRLFKIVRKFIPVSHNLDGHKLFTVENGKRVVTVLFMALLVIETSDVVFAVDSVPAILAVSRTPFIIIASNAAAILGMRALYFVFEFIKDKFWLLNHALGVLLLFVGVKMLIAPDKILGFNWFGIHLPTLVSLGVITTLISGAIIGSLVLPRKVSSKP